MYVEIGSVGIVRAERGNDDSVDVTTRLVAKVARWLVGERELFDANGQRRSVFVPKQRP